MSRPDAGPCEFDARTAERNMNAEVFVPFTRYQKFVVAVLAFLQFTIILDFMIMSPLGAIMMPALNMDPKQFGVVVSVYAFSAGGASLLAAGFADRFDRKKMLMFFYSGFLLGTLFCALAPTYHYLVAARVVTGLFGGVVGSVVFAIVTDLFAMDQRGRVMGWVQTAFAASQVLGLPAGLFLSNHWGWHMPFLMIVGIGAIVGVVIFVNLKPIDSHLHLPMDRTPFAHFISTLTNKNYLLAFFATAFLSLGGFMIMPFSSAFTVHNVGIHVDQLPLIYLVTGLCSILILPIVGKASDSFGKYRIFVMGSILSAVMVLIYTNLGVTPLANVMLVNVVMFVGIFSRMVPSQALMSAIPAPASRGSFMSVSSSLQQMAGGIGSVVAGLIVVQAPDNTIQHFDTIGLVMLGTITVSVIMMYFINKMVAA